MKNKFLVTECEMRQRRRVRYALEPVALKLSAFVSMVCVVLAIPLSALAQPNFILINTDDMRDDDVQFLPQTLDLLAEQGTRFVNSFVVDAVCAPSRAAFLRGQHSHNHGVWDNRFYRTFYGSGLEDSTLATWLNEVGYSTVLLGKYMNGYPLNRDREHIPPGWDEWYALMGRQPYYNFNMNQNGTTVSYGSSEADYLTDVLSNLALDYLDRHQDDVAPFFMYVGTVAPHSPPIPARRHIRTYPDLTAPRLPSFNEEDVSDKPEWISELAIMDSTAINRVDTTYRRRAETLLAVDEMVVALVDKLTAQGKLENTFIIFTSDNGWLNGEHRLQLGKGNAYEESIRVPLIVRGPGVTAGAQLEHFALNIDLAPTIADLAEASKPEFVDGKSLADALTGVAPMEPSPNQRFLIERLTTDPRAFAAPRHKALRTDDYLYVMYTDSDERELYDLTVDPYQLDSFHDSADEQLLQDLETSLLELENCVGTAACRPE